MQVSGEKRKLHNLPEFYESIMTFFCGKCKLYFPFIAKSSYVNLFCICISTAGKFKSNNTINAFHAELLAGTHAVPQPTKVCSNL
jgi:hypothetical protein